jgi:Spy/CpxP family protein refolding chaperone
MKRIMIWSGVALLLVVVGIGVVRADGTGRHEWGAGRWGHHGPFRYFAHELNLSDTQRSQIKSIWLTEQPAVTPLVHELATEGKEMDSATAQGNLDEGKVQTIATRQGETIAKLSVEKERFLSKIYITVLNPEQRNKADEMQKEWHAHLDHLADRIGHDGGVDSHD